MLVKRRKAELKGSLEDDIEQAKPVTFASFVGQFQ